MDRNYHSVEIDIPDHLTPKIENRLKHTKFDTVESYITYIVEEAVHHLEMNHSTDSSNEIQEEEVKSRLKSLGYLKE